MDQLICLYKPLGLTPLQAIERFVAKRKEYKGKKASYCGRLDPLAEGVLLMLAGEGTKQMQTYMGLDKTYEAEIILVLNTDTLDLLGLATKGEQIAIDEKVLKKKIRNFVGNYTQEIPAYSSFIVKGKALWMHARSGNLDQIILPQTKVKIKKILVGDVYTIQSSRLLKEIKKKVGLVVGDFRQEAIIARWEELLSGKQDAFTVVKVTIDCSSGTYIRAIARDVGREYGGGILLSLKRTKVGKFTIKNCEKV